MTLGAKIRRRGGAAGVALAILLLIAGTSAQATDLLGEADKILKGGSSSSKGSTGGGSSGGQEPSGGVGKVLENVLKGGGNTKVSSLTDSEITRGLRDALRVGSERVVGSLGRVDGFNLSDVHIPLPGVLGKVQKVLQKVGQSGLADDLELRLNRAAEIATPLAKNLFFQSIRDMTLSDVRDILTGPDDSATQYFRGKMSNPLAKGMMPIVDDALADAGAIKAYDRMMGAYKNVPLVPDVKADLTTYVLEKAIDGIFLYLGREEAAIRQNPAKRTTEIMKKVFGAL